MGLNGALPLPDGRRRGGALANPAAPRATAAALADAAVAALLDELAAYPKPGLVSPIDSGAHTDMDHALMCRSARALRRPFARIAAAGAEGRPFAASLVPLGLEAERVMLRATDGVNTHRGAIFSLGMIVAAVARARATPAAVTPAGVRRALQREWGAALAAHAARGDSAPSHGAVVRARTGVGGARDEAALGFPGVFAIGVPAYRGAIATGLDRNAACVHTLFTLMADIEDTNVLFRGGPEAGAFVRRAAAGFLAVGGCTGPGWFARAEELHRDFVRRNLSPGGCADLLAATLLVLACSGEATPE